MLLEVLGAILINYCETNLVYYFIFKMALLSASESKSLGL